MRERGEDIIDLGRHFLEQYTQKHQRKGLHLSAESEDVLRNHSWPGNVRQLQHCIERAVLMTDGVKIEPGDIFPESFNLPMHNKSQKLTLAEVEMQTIRDSIRRNGGNLSKAARELGVARSTLYNKIKTYGI